MLTAMERPAHRMSIQRPRSLATVVSTGAAGPQNDTWGDATRLDFDERCRR